MGEEASEEGPYLLARWDRSCLQLVFSDYLWSTRGPRTKKSIEGTLDIPIAGIQNCLDHCSIDTWESFFQRVLRLLSWAQRPRRLRRGSWGCFAVGLLSWCCIARRSVRVLGLIVKVQGTRRGRRLSTRAVGCRGRGLARSGLRTRMSFWFTDAAWV